MNEKKKKKMRVLAAEDSPTQAAVLRSHLEEAGFDVSVATNGAEALHLMTTETFDIVVSDIVMPDVDGYQLCQGIKERYPTVPVVLLTSMADPLDVVNALAAGADNFLRKPYEPEELVHRVANMLHNKALRESGRTQMGLELFFLGRRFMINSDREQILDLLVSTFEDLVAMNHRLRAREDDLAVVHAALATQLAEASLERDRVTGVLRAMPAGMAVFDVEGRIINGNQRLADLIGRPLSALQGAIVWDVIEFVDHAGARLSHEERALTKTLCEGRGATAGTAFDLFIEGPDGDRIPVLARTEPIWAADGQVAGAVGTLEDLRSLMDHDPVTGFAGHEVLADRLAAAATTSSERGLTTGLVVVVLDRYERIRQSLPGTGEQVMAAVASRLRESLASDGIRQRTPTASAAYLGNGELVVVLPELDGRADAVAVAHLLTRQLADTVEIEGVDVSVTVSAAVGMCAADTDAVSMVASVAASARSASVAGGGRVAGIEDAANVAVMDLLRRESELRSAIDTGQLTVHYQPQVRVRDQSPVAIEALVRWQHPDRGLLGADEVIPLAVETGLISAVGWLVLEEACGHVGTWSKGLPHHLRPSLSVNLAAEQLADEGIVERVDRILAETGFDPKRLVLEITEGSVMGDPDAAWRRLTALKALGVRLAVDDFGTGYSSLMQLRRLPIDILKIDRAFTAGMLVEPADAAIVSSTIRLARALGLEVVGEGVENADQLVQLRVLGCDLGQGFLWARPMPVDALAAWWSEHASGPHTEPLVDPSGYETDDRQDEAISYLVHELRSPLAAITGFAELLQDAAAGEAPAEYVDAIARNARELDNRLQSLREVDELLRGGLTLQPEDRDVSELVETLVHDLAPGLHPLRVDFSSAGAACASVDAVRLTQAVTNLITNAAKFSPSGQPVEVHVSGTGTLVEVTVRDHGPGIPEHRRPELFRRFSRLGAKSTGMGLGLYLSRTVVDAHGGVVRYDDAPGGGAVFSVRLPQRSVAVCGGSPKYTPARVDGPLDQAMVSALAELDADSEDGDGIDRLVRSAISTAHERLESMERAASYDDTDGLRRHAHALRGAVGNLGAHVVAQRCRELEKAAARGDATLIRSGVAGVAEALTEAEDALLEVFPFK